MGFAIDEDLDAAGAFGAVVAEQYVLPFAELEGLCGDDFEGFVGPVVDEVGGGFAGFEDEVIAAVGGGVIHAAEDGGGIAGEGADPDGEGEALVGFEVADGVS